MRMLLRALALCVIGAVAPRVAVGQWNPIAAPPTHRLVFAPGVQKALDSIRVAALRDTIEGAKCVTAYTVASDTLTIHGLSTSQTFVRAVRDTIYARGLLCPRGVPILHTHLVFMDISPLPSDVDLATQLRSGTWALILNITDKGWFITVY